jgi:hypothetical protein
MLGGETPDVNPDLKFNVQADTEPDMKPDEKADAQPDEKPDVVTGNGEPLGAGGFRETALRVLRLMFGESRGSRWAGFCVLVSIPVILYPYRVGPRLASIAGCVALGCTAFLQLKRRLVYIALVILTLFVSIGLNGAQVLLREATETPEVAIPVISVSVVPGGDFFHTRITPERCMQAAVCFYKDGVAVVAAHSCELSPGVLDNHTLLNDVHVEGRVNVIEDNSWGFAVSPLYPPVDREEMPLGNAHEVAVGEPAQCLPPDSEPFDVEIAGWAMREDRQYIVLVSPRRITEGMSGTPVLQGGRIIGFLAAKWAFPSRAPYIAYASPAAAVYDAFRDHLGGR